MCSSSVEGRINNQIMGVKGLTPCEQGFLDIFL